jgi:dTDP-4-dehydrorhamnose reductase
LFVGRPEFDLGNEASIRNVIASAGPDVIVNAAAYTAVDQAETDQEAAWQQNACAPATIAKAAAEISAKLIHVSTDYVFDGKGAVPYLEDAQVNPTNFYGRTKLEAERAISSTFDDHIIVRTSWVYSPFGKNFVKTMLALAETRDELRVVADQVGSPTSALDLADGLLAVLGRWEDDPELGLGSIYHLAGSGHTSWAGLAERVMSTSRQLGGAGAAVVPIATSDYPTPAPRPAYSIMNSARFERIFGYRAPHWEAATDAVVRRLLSRTKDQTLPE